MNSKFILIFLFVFLFIGNSFSTTYYWKGGQGNWSDLTHWSLTPGGVDAPSLPTSADSVVFDATSGLIANTDTVFLNIPVHVANFDYEFALGPFVFDGMLPSIQIDGSFKSNGTATFNWPVIISLGPTSLSELVSNGANWNNEFFINGTDTVLVVDELITTQDITLESGILLLDGNNLTCQNFFSNSGIARTFDCSNSTITVNGDSWDVAPANMTTVSTNSSIHLVNPTTFNFLGGDQTYGGIHVSSTEISIQFSNFFEFINLVSNPIVNLENGSTQSIFNFSSAGTCGSPTLIQTISPGASANIQYLGGGAFTAYNLTIDNVDAVHPPTDYFIYVSDTLNGADGWTFAGSNFYWIGGTGNWSDPSHWSLSSNGPSSGCIPGQEDTVIFDANSFTAAGQMVNLNVAPSFTSMDWSTIDETTTLRMTNNATSYGDVSFSPLLTLDTLAGAPRRFDLRGTASFDPQNATIKCNVSINTVNNADQVYLSSSLNIASNRNLFIGKGEFYSVGSSIKAGSIITSINDTLNDLRVLDISNSDVELAVGFYALNEGANFTFNALNSHLKIIDTNGTKVNYLQTEGLTFHDVTLDVKGTASAQRISGDNTFSKLNVLKNSTLVFDSTSTQTVLDSLIMLGTCKDSIYIKSNNASFPANISITNPLAAKLECLDIQGMNSSSSTLDVLYSTNSGSNTNFTFNPATATTSSFTANGPYCFGDTTFFTNNSTAVSGNTNDITSQWFFNDGSTGYFAPINATDSIYVTYEADTNKHAFIVAGDINVQLVTMYTNYCTDTATVLVHINDPSFQFSTSQPDTIICAGDVVTFENNSSNPNLSFEFFLNGNSLNTPSITDTLYVTDSIVQNDVIGAIAYENGCITQDTASFTFTVNNLPVISWSSNDPDTTICAGQVVNFTAQSGIWTDAFRYYKNHVGTTSFIDSISNWSTSTIANNDTISVVGKTDAGCYDTLSMIFTVNPLPTTTLVAETPSGVVCTGDQLNFTANGATTYEFFVAGVSQGAPSATNTFSTSSLTTGQTVSVKGYFATGCEKNAPQTFVYTVNPLPILSFTSSDADTSICSGTTINFNAGGASLYEFFVNGVSQGAQSSFSTFSSSTLANNDQVYVEGEFSGCAATSGIMTFEVLASPSTTLASNDADQTICQGTPVLFTAGGATNYEFLIDGNTQGAPSTTPTFSSSSLNNNQTITVNGESNGCIVSQSLTFTVLSVPNVNIFSSDADNTVCEGQSITFTGTNGATYDLILNGSSVGSQASPTFTPALPNGTSTVFIIGTAPNGCADTSAVLTNINVIALPTVNVTSSDVDNIICAGTSVTFTGAGSSQYQFFIDGSPIGSMSSTTQFTTSNLTDGQTVYAVGSTSGCTNNSNSIVTTVNPSPTVTMSSTDVDNVFCTNQLVTFTANGATNYEFFVNGVSQGPSSPTNTINSTGFATGTYTVQVVGEANNCTNFNTKTITVNPVPTASIASSDVDNIICQGEYVNFTGTGGTLYSFNLNGTPVTSPSPSNNYSSISLLDGDMISVNTFTAAGCSSTSSNIVMTVNPTPTIGFVSSDADQAICIGDNVDFTASGATDYEFFINGVSQGAPSTTSVLSTSSLANGDVISVNGSSLGCGSNATPFTFTVYQYPVVDIVNNAQGQICVGENTDITASGADNYQFLVNGLPTGAFIPSPAFNAPVANGDVITVIGETNGCETTSSSNVTYVVYDYPTITSSSSDADNIICLNDTITFNASGAMTYVFAINGMEAQNSASTTYSNHTIADGDLISITGFNGDCPSTDDTYLFTVNSMDLGINVTNSTLICTGENATFTASGGDEYQFFLNSVATGPQSATNTFSSSTLVNQDQIDVLAHSTITGCFQWLEDFVIMNVIDEPTISELSSLEFCEGDSVVLVSNSPYGNQWYVDGNIITGATDTSYTAFTSGLYTLETTIGGTGNVWSIGHNGTGSFGDGTNFNSSSPSQAISSETITEISGGLEFVLAKTASGNVLSWGKNSSGQLGLGTYTPHNLPQMVPVVSDVKTVATSETSSMVVTNSGAVYVWGNNTVGQLGTGNTSVINFPFLNASLTNVDSIAGGKTHFVILKNDGTVWTVGSNGSGQLGTGDLVPSMAAVQVATLSNIVAVGAGEYHSFAIDNAGDVYAWGNNGSGQLGLGDLNNRLTPTLVPLKNVVNAQGGANHSAFLTQNKKVYTSGGNLYGQLGIGSTVSSTTIQETNLQGVTMISAGQYSTMALRSDKSTFAFGNNAENQLMASGTIITSPAQIPALAGVGFIESNNLASHFIFSENHACTSAGATVNMLSAPDVVITESNDVLTASETGVSYQWFYETNPAVLGTNQSFATSNPGVYYVVVTFANGCTSTSELYYHHVIGIEDLSKIEMVLYPNPVQNELTMELKGYSGELNVAIYDQAGRLIHHESTNNTNTHHIATESLQNGIYWLKVSTETTEETFKFVKAN